MIEVIQQAVRKAFGLDLTEDEKRVEALGAKAFEENDGRNPYPAGTTRHRAWQRGHDGAESTADSAW